MLPGNIGPRAWEYTPNTAMSLLKMTEGLYSTEWLMYIKLC